MVTLVEYRKAQKIISQYNEQLKKEQLGDRIVPLKKSAISSQLYSTLIYYFAKEKGINTKSVTLNHISQLTEREFKEIPRIGKIRFAQINALLMANGFPILSFSYPY